MPVPPGCRDSVAAEQTWDQKRELLASKTPANLGYVLGLPNAAGGYILYLERRLLELEERVANLQPPHLASVEKR